MNYFGNQKIDAIKTEDVNDFWRWRLEYAKSAEAEKIRRHGIKVVKNRISSERTEIERIDWENSMGCHV